MFHWLYKLLDRRYGKRGALVVRVTDKSSSTDTSQILYPGDSLCVNVGVSFLPEGFGDNAPMRLTKQVLFTVEEE